MHHKTCNFSQEDKNTMYKIGILSDTHNLLRESVTDLLRTCDVILHAGDISSPQLLNQLKSIAPLYAVRGNTDKELAAELPHSLSINLYGINIFMIHNKKLITDDIHDKNLIIYGHSHKYEQLQNNGQTWLNPGSCGRRRFSLPVTMAVLSVPELGAFEIQRIQFSSDGKSADCITGSMPSGQNMKQIVIRVMKETDKGKSVQDIAKVCQISEELSTQICRLYLTHPGVTPDGILGKMGM